MRESAWRGTWQPNKRPFITMAPDCYVSLQGETTIIGCGECRRVVNYNDYITGITTEASVDSPPGSATISLSIPDNDVNEFFSDGQFLIGPMMEVEIFAKGAFLIGGFPQYYRIFWGLVQSVSKSWSNGTSSISVQCKDILRWWELTNTTINPAFLEAGGSSAGGYQLFQNQFSGQNPYATIAQLAQDAMGDFFYTTGSFTSFTPEKGPENGAIGSFMQDIMAYWQLKFSNIGANLVMFGTSGQAYSFSGVKGTVSPNRILDQIVKEEVRLLKQNQSTTLLFSSPKEVATAKVEVARAGDVEFFQNDTQSKLSLAMHAREQLGYEFYCDTTGDIVFKPPFYNLNVLPNKPVSWVQDFDIIDDQITDSEAEVVTHVTSSGNAFGGVTDWGLNDEITTPRTGVYDFHLLRRYGWRRADLQLEWAGNPRKLFFHLLDWMDRLNSKRQNGSVTIPMRPELRMGFPIWMPKYDSFFYVQGISHQYSVGGQATTSLTLTAKRSKFVAPRNIGEIKKGQGTRDVTSDVKRNLKGADQTYDVTFPGSDNSTSGLSSTDTTGIAGPAIVRDPKTGRLLGAPNVVMVFKRTYSGVDLSKIMQSKGKSTLPNTGKQNAAVKGTNKGLDRGTQVNQTLLQTQDDNKNVLIARLRAHRYEAGMTNAGAYEYAFDRSRIFRELALIPLNSYTTNPTPEGADAKSVLNSSPDNAQQQKTENAQFSADQKKLVGEKNDDLSVAKKAFDTATTALNKATAALLAARKKAGKNIPVDGNADSATNDLAAAVELAKADQKKASDALAMAQLALNAQKAAKPSKTYIPQLNVLVRPVSDEFGFEVIGHYRYGRGAYIDRGKLQIPTDDRTTGQPIVANQLNIQFAPSGGFLTDSPNGSNVTGTADSFASLFEQMRPEDYVTGASFSGTSSPHDTVSNVQTTSASTYTNNINADKGTGLYIEADATRRAKTLGEMTPTIDIAGISKAFDNCACGLNRTDWFTLLPSDLISVVLAPAGSEGQDKVYTREGADSFNDQLAKDDPRRVVPGQVITSGLSMQGQVGGGQVLLSSPGSDPGPPVNFPTSASFFKELNKFLSDKFDKTISKNVDRETSYTLGGSQNFASADANPLGLGDDEQDNVLGDPENPLFGRASQGDPAALAALQKQVNFNFGLTAGAVKDFGSTLQAQGDRASHVGTVLGQGLNNLGSPVSATTNPAQQYQPPAPTVSDPINQSRFDNAGYPQSLTRDPNAPQTAFTDRGQSLKRP